MPTTPRGYAYPTGTDAPAGPYQLQALAEDIDADVAAVVATIPDVIVAPVTGPATQTDVGTGGGSVVSGGTMTWRAGRRYRITAYAEGSQVTAAGDVTVRLGGTLGLTHRLLQTNALAVGKTAAGSVVAYHTPAADVSATVVVYGITTAGVFRFAPNTIQLTVEDVT